MGVIAALLASGALLCLLVYAIFKIDLWIKRARRLRHWTWLVLLAYTQLRLARLAIEDRHLPWERPQRPTRRALTPARVRQAFPQLLVTLDTPADPPKPSGRSPGRPLGRRSGPAPRYPAIKKAA